MLVHQSNLALCFHSSLKPKLSTGSSWKQANLTLHTYGLFFNIHMSYSKLAQMKPMCSFPAFFTLKDLPRIGLGSNQAVYNFNRTCTLFISQWQISLNIMVYAKSFPINNYLKKKNWSFSQNSIEPRQFHQKKKVGKTKEKLKIFIGKNKILSNWQINIYKLLKRQACLFGQLKRKYKLIFFLGLKGFILFLFSYPNPIVYSFCQKKYG